MMEMVDNVARSRMLRCVVLEHVLQDGPGSANDAGAFFQLRTD